MICDRCKKNRAQHYKKIEINGKQQFLHLCTNCINEEAQNQFTQAKVGESLQKSEQNFTENRLCPICFSSIKSIRKAGLVGCANCYNVFRAELLKNIEKIQKATSHTGKKK